MTSTVDEINDPVHEEELALQGSGDLDTDLRDLARRLLKRVIHPLRLQLRRLVISEASRFPELGRTFYKRGPGRSIDDLASPFEQLASRGELQSIRLAASQFNWLVASAPINQAMLLGHDKALRPAEINPLRWVPHTCCVAAGAVSLRLLLPAGSSHRRAASLARLGGRPAGACADAKPGLRRRRQRSRNSPEPKDNTLDCSLDCFVSQRAVSSGS